MRSTGHPVDAAAMQDHYETSRAALESFPADREEQIAARNALFFSLHLYDALVFTTSAYVMERPPEEICAAAAAALREIPAVFELDGVLDAEQMRNFTAAAIALGDADTREVAGSVPEAQFSDPESEVSPVAFAYVQVLQTLARGDRKAAQRAVEAAEPLLAPDQLLIQPRWEKAYFGTALALAAALLRADAAAFTAAWSERHGFHHREYGKPSFRADARVVLDWQALAFGRLALEAGLEPRPVNPYAPEELLRCKGAA